ncbi:MAG TPA: response regulator [Candidatus Saccharimonadales bacterium]|nr:response regulator [Candidatus Saccharimonadales bacterium]
MAQVLIIDDDELLRTALTHKLRERGIEAEQAIDGQKGLELAKMDPPQVIVLDERMPKMTGDEFITAVQKEPWFSNVHIVVFTASDDTKLLYNSLKAGVTDYLDKTSATPDSIAELVAKYVQA